MATTASTKNTNNSQSTTSFSDLPPDFVVEIFSRLPAKTLIRSSLVSKTWYSLIVNPNFISAQIRHYVSSSDNNAVLIIPPYIPEQRHAYLISAQTGSVIEKFEVPFNTVTGSLKVLGSINGLLLLTDLHGQHDCRDLYLWNPSVRMHRVVVSSCFKKLVNNREDSYYNVGLGFCKSSSDYKVVRIVYKVDSKMRRFGDVAPQVEIYSLRRRTWTRMKDPKVPRLVSANGTCVNGSYYWLAEAKPGTQDVDKTKCALDELWVLSFDFDTEMFGELKLSDEICKCASKIGQCQLMVFEGSLCVCVFGREQSNGVTSYPYYIWAMRQENGGIFWDLRFKVGLEQSGWPMNITKSGMLVIESCPLQRLDMTSIFSRDLKSNRYKNLGFGKCGGIEDDVMYLVAPATVDTSFVESFVMYEGGKSVVKYAK